MMGEELVTHAKVGLVHFLVNIISVTLNET